MKKNTYLILAIAAIFALSSCKKDYTCNCTSEVTHSGFTIPSSKSEVITDTKKNAEKTCDERQEGYQAKVNGYGTVSCSLSK